MVAAMSADHGRASSRNYNGQRFFRRVRQASADMPEAQLGKGRRREMGKTLRVCVTAYTGSMLEKSSMDTVGFGTGFGAYGNPACPSFIVWHGLRQSKFFDDWRSRS